MKNHDRGILASRRTAVGLVGYAPRFVPNHGHPALIPDASGPAWICRACALRLPVRAFVGDGWGGLAVPFTVPRRARRQGLRALRVLASCGRLRPLTACAAPCWQRFRAIPPE
ncbi:hypothetical protein PG1C_09220 [Rugosibacter aromaticivorans]|uniref:Uncharacterized protein n=1 Tax=Rugosibacter aromaticivorans TaxID=1565605 RepID=A0A0C5J9F3_9PROT|nr:hypothetical protein [Rugosibacter aromaticivorans]AJP48575.1 hypothetical protein PG1C_09220 [Rugosibacter aromaticivorans]